MSLDKRVRWLVKEEDDGARTIYQWTPTLAQKPGFSPVSVEDAEEIIAAESKAQAARVAKAKNFIDVPEDNPVTAEVKPATSPVGGEDLNLIKTNADLLKEETDKVNSMSDSAALEEYFLLKYRTELLPGDLEAMKKQATDMLAEFADQNKLYEVKK